MRVVGSEKRKENIKVRRWSQSATKRGEPKTNPSLLTAVLSLGAIRTSTPAISYVPVLLLHVPCAQYVNTILLSVLSSKYIFACVRQGSRKRKSHCRCVLQSLLIMRAIMSKTPQVGKSIPLLGVLYLNHLPKNVFKASEYFVATTSSTFLSTGHLTEGKLKMLKSWTSLKVQRLSVNHQKVKHQKREVRGSSVSSLAPNAEFFASTSRKLPIY